LKQLFQQEIINYIKNNESSLYEENNTFHISTVSLTLDLKNREVLANYLLKYVERFNPGSIVALTEGMDQGIIDLSSIIRYKSQKPYFYYNLDDPEEPLVISSNLSDCMLFIPYLSNKNQFLYYLKFLENHGATPKLIICIFREAKEDFEGICKIKHVNFEALFDLQDILFQLKEHKEIIEKLMRNRVKF
jgi:hypothetical protein